MVQKLLVAALPLLALSSQAPAQTVSEADLRRHIEVLASDAYEGRRPGTAGGERTEAYLVDAFARAGLKPGTRDGTWRQLLRLGERKPLSSRVTWSRDGQPIVSRDGETAMLGRQPHVRVDKAPVLYAGYGTAEELKGANLRNVVILRLSGDAPSGRTRLSDEELFAQGASAVVNILPPEKPWARPSGGYFQAVSTGAVDGSMSAAAAAELLRAAGEDPDTLRSAAATASFRAVPLKLHADLDVETEVRAFDTANIVGKIPGSIRPEEAVVLLAHWDHLGLCRPEGAADRICNGAIDNASGTAILIEVARQLASGPKPGRTIYILATTSEETGLLGATAFAESPPVPGSSIVAALNFDTTALGPKGLPVALLGRGKYPKIDAIVDQTVRAAGRKVDSDTEANVMVTRQDGWAFAKRGIPAFMVTGSISDMNILKAYLSGGYHGPQDDIAHLKELGGAAEDAVLNIAVARALADPKLYPKP